tara:strand:+ start:1850 stop:4393 length:2544 start_codon:yes stop_codon:yes gene_type:complete
MIEEIKDKVVDYFEGSKDLRVLFFFDEQQEYAETIDDLSIPNVTLVKWEDNPFTLKVRLTDELKSEKVLLYLPMKHPSNQDEYHNFPLMGLLIANKELQLDDTGSFIEEFGLGRHQKSLVTKYMSELKYTGVKDVCKPILTPQKLTEELLQQGILSATLKFSRIQNWSVLIAKMATLVLNEADYTKVIKKVSGLNMQEAILKQVKQLIDTPITDLSLDSLKTVGQSLRYNQITQTIPEAESSDPYIALKTKDQEKITQLNQLLFSIEVDKHLSKQIEELFDKVDQEIKGERIIETYGSEQEYAVYSESMLWRVIQDTLNHLFDNPANAYKQLEKLSLQNGLKKEIAATIAFLSQSAKLIRQLTAVQSYILNSPEDYIQWYEKEGYLIDQYYRRSISSRKLIDDTELPDTLGLDDIVNKLNELYDAHTDKLNREWLSCLNEKKFDYSKINHPKQYDFYKTEIEPTDQKVVVIISDALRYEAGMELLSAMHGDSKNTAEVRSMIASLPSKTNIGMAQLLPGNELKFNEGNISIDEISSSGTDNREAIIKSQKDKSRAVQYESLNGVGQEERRELFKNELVYVYHDVIDSTGDKKPSERRTFDAVTDSIEELRKFIKSLHATYNVAKVYITADHGFLYSDNSIQDKNLEKIDETNAISTHNRYFISSVNSKQDLGYTFPISKTTRFNDDVFVTVPKSINRYRKQGVGHQFVHGGGSLQELIVPLIESSRKIKPVSNKVSPQLVSNRSLTVVSNVMRIDILQKEPVSRFEKDRSISIGLYDGLKLVSNEEIKLMNFTSDSPSERMLRVELVLSAGGPDTSFLKLKIFDTEDKMNPLIEERIQNNTLIQPDF